MTTTKPNLIATANTTHRFAIGIITGDGRGFAVIRMDPESRYIILSRHHTEAGARKDANRQWLRDTGRA